MTKEIVQIPDLGGADEVEIIEICVAVGDRVEAEQSLVVLESDKASMEVPAPFAGEVVEIQVAVGDTVTKGHNLLVMVVEGGESGSAEEIAAPDNAAEDVAAPTVESVSVEKKEVPTTQSSAVETVNVPDLGTSDAVEVIELCVAVGDVVEVGDSLLVLESDKASMEVPSPFSGTVTVLHTQVGAQLTEGKAILDMETAASVSVAEKTAPVTAPQPESSIERPLEKALPDSKVEPIPTQVTSPIMESRPSKDVHAGPAVRMMARELGVDLGLVTGSGPKNRILKEDVQGYVKQRLTEKSVPGASATGGAGIPSVPEVDFSKFGEVRIEKMSRLHKVTAANMHRSWLNVPHVTQFDDADITDLEAFRNKLKPEAAQREVKVTPLPFLLKACAAALKANPAFNASLHADGEQIVYKNYVHIGIAVDTPVGLMVPVIRDVDKKSVWDLAAETVELAQKAKDRKLTPDEMQGGCFTISSLGGMGGTGFTPIVNSPEVGILGVSKLSVKPVWNGSDFEPRKMLPLSLSYDHRAVNGADAGKFMTFLVQVLGDIRRLSL